jgi:uncharacterized membrane protein
VTQPTGAAAPPEPPVTDGRVLSLSDGVFAFALTLMVLTVAVPTPATVAPADLPAAVRRQWPEFFSYAISFWVVAVFWFAHRRLLRLVVADDAPSGWLNIAFLFAVAFLPYPTDMLGNYGADGFALAFYDGSMVVTSLTLTALSEWVTAHPQLTGGPLSPRVRRYQRLRAATTAGPFLLSLLLVPVSVTAARLCLLLIAIGHLGVQRAAPTRHHHTAATP